MSFKKCFCCGFVLGAEHFYQHKKMKDGRLNKCKECVKANVRKNRADKIQHYRQYDKLRASVPHRAAAREVYQATPRGVESVKRAKLAWAERNPEKRRAHNILSKAVAKGVVLPHPCFVCGREDSEAHHPDYSAPLAVTWLCSAHHAQVHKEAREILRAA
jgi:DNA-directed RNA polymerase subunit N (RpoN/RPB10)